MLFNLSTNQINLSNAVTIAADNTMIINGFLNQVSTPATNTPTILGQSETSSPENNVDVAATENKITMAAAEIILCYSPKGLLDRVAKPLMLALNKYQPPTAVFR